MDWDEASATKCWHHIGSIGTQRNTPGIDHYILLDRCPQRKDILYIPCYDKKDEISEDVKILKYLQGSVDVQVSTGNLEFLYT